ncbi:MAG: hypothetical protein ABS46_08280 [Cytophagaceae bacterium SCN 52-12]|nr:MAG: hypothetical protein ABS46_08280 [Cytophagaceae bacterium SCN 52-12]
MTIAVFDKRTVASLASGDPYVQKARAICLDWLNGKESYMLPTSGSTGPPKQIEVRADQLKASVYATSEALSLYQGTRVLACLNIDYVAGFMMLIRAMELDWEVTLLAPSSNPLLLLPEESEFDFTALVPMQLYEIISNPETSHRAKKLGKILLGGVGLSRSQEEAFKKLDQEVYLGYGMTETVSHVALQRVGEASAGRFYLTGDVEFGTDPRGCLFFNGAVTGYQPVQTNDLATVFREERAFQLHGRIDHVVNSGGIKIQLEEMESQIGELLAANGVFSDFFLWKIPDERLGNALVLVVEGAPELEEKISGILRKGLDRLKRPRKLYFTGSFFRTGSDKTDKYRTFEGLTGA